MENIPRNLFVGMDQTSCQVVSSGNTTIDFKGAGEVIVLYPAGDHECFTVTLQLRQTVANSQLMLCSKAIAKMGSCLSVR